MIKVDIHTHTIASHGKATVEEMYKAAAEKRLDFFGISEHSPLPPGYSCQLYSGDLRITFPEFANEVMARREQVNNSGLGCPHLLLGMELDWIPSNMVYMSELSKKWPFDYIIGGLHFLGKIAIGAEKNWGRETDNAVGLETGRDGCPTSLGFAALQTENNISQDINELFFERYFAYYREMAVMARSGLVDIVAHPDFVKLRCYSQFNKWLAQKSSLDHVAATLAVLKKSGVALEVSSAGLRQAFFEPYPGPDIMGIASDIGVEISFASDAHSTFDIAGDFARLEEYASSFGFQKAVYFVGRKAQTYFFRSNS